MISATWDLVGVLAPTGVVHSSNDGLIYTICALTFVEFDIYSICGLEAIRESLHPSNLDQALVQ
jgi:hypothetical protein